MFGELPQETLRGLAQKAIRRAFQTQEIVVHAGDVWPYLFLVEGGEIKAVKESPEGRTLIATTLKPGDIFWGLAFFIENAAMPVMLQAGQNSVIHLWARRELVPVIKENASMSWNLCQLMLNRMQMAGDIVENLAFHPVMSRLAGLLLDVYGDADREFMTRDITLDEMAARIGTTREMVCRHLYQFAEKGAIEINRTELKIQNRAFLENQARK